MHYILIQSSAKVIKICFRTEEMLKTKIPRSFTQKYFSDRGEKILKGKFSKKSKNIKNPKNQKCSKKSQNFQKSIKHFRKKKYKNFSKKKT